LAKSSVSDPVFVKIRKQNQDKLKNALNVNVFGNDITKLKQFVGILIFQLLV